MKKPYHTFGQEFLLLKNKDIRLKCRITLPLERWIIRLLLIFSTIPASFILLFFAKTITQISFCGISLLISLLLLFVIEVKNLKIIRRKILLHALHAHRAKIKRRHLDSKIAEFNSLLPEPRYRVKALPKATRKSQLVIKTALDDKSLPPNLEKQAKKLLRAYTELKTEEDTIAQMEQKRLAS